MELLDDNLNFASTPTEGSIARIRKLRLDYDREAKHVKNARTAIIIVSVLTGIQLLASLSIVYDPWSMAVAVIFLLIYIGCAVAPIEHARISLTIASVLYGLSLLLILLSGEVLLMIIAFVIRGFILYFMIKGAVSAFKLHDISKQMKINNVTPYQY